MVAHAFDECCVLCFSLMNTVAILPSTHAGDRLLYGCIGVSVVVHALMLWQALPVRPQEPPPPRITATLREAARPLVEPVELSKPEPARQRSKPEPKPEAGPRAKPAAAPPDPQTTRFKPTEVPLANVAPAVPPAGAPSLVAPPVVAPAPVETRSDVKAEKDAPRSIPAAPPSPVPEISDKVLVEAYQNQLASIIETRKLKRYPSEAIQNHWEGASTVVLKIGSDGKIAGVETTSSSGHDMLDEQARISLSKGKPFVQIPDGLKGKPFEARVRVVFSLSN